MRLTVLQKIAEAEEKLRKTEIFMKIRDYYLQNLCAADCGLSYKGRDIIYQELQAEGLCDGCGAVKPLRCPVWDMDVKVLDKIATEYYPLIKEAEEAEDEKTAEGAVLRQFLKS